MFLTNCTETGNNNFLGAFCPLAVLITETVR